MTGGSRRLVALSGLAPAVLIGGLSLVQPAFLASLQHGVYDTLVGWAPVQPPSGRVVIVDIDERSLAEVGQWPWRRERIGGLVDGLRRLGAGTVALDIVFAEADRHESAAADPDATLAEMLRGGRVVLGYALTFDAEPTTASGDCVRHPVSLAVVRHELEETGEPFFQATRAICNVAALTGAAASSGFLNAAPDSDGILRRAPLLLEFNGQVYPSLALAMVSAARGTTNGILRVSNVNASSLTLDQAPGAAAVPLDGKSNLLVRFRGPKRTFPYVSAVDVLKGTVPPADIRGKLVLVGTTALGTREVVATPLDTLFTGVEVQATIADNLLQQDYYHELDSGVAIETAAVLALGGLATWLAVHVSLLWGALASVSSLGLMWAGAVALLSAHGAVLSPLLPTLGLSASLASLTAAGLLVERRRADHAGYRKVASERLMVQTLLSLVESRDPATGTHSRRTQRYTRLLADALAAHPAFREYLTPERVELLSVLAPLHDIGKVGVPDHVLHKPGRLTEDELAEMRKHPVRGRDVIISAEHAAGVRDDETLAIAKEIVYSHHEKWDGTGYPEGLRGAAIPIAGRIIAIVDVYDAMRSPRPYHRAMTHDEVIEVIARGRGAHFDPDVVDAYLRVAPQLQQLSEADALQ